MSQKKVKKITEIVSPTLLLENFLSAISGAAPNYFGNHHMTSQGWNYPAPTGQETMEREFTADFSTQLPYHPAPEVFRINQSDSSSDADSSMTSTNSYPKKLSLNNNISEDSVKPVKTTEIEAISILLYFQLILIISFNF